MGAGSVITLVTLVTLAQVDGELREVRASRQVAPRAVVIMTGTNNLAVNGGHLR
jgi:hypothetical protein